ncbi:hypothetical protein ACS0TY_009247 [Phlomoides rotata]
MVDGDHDLTRFRAENKEGGEESCGSSKKSRTSKYGKYSIPSSLETPGYGCSTSTIPRPISKNKVKKKGKGKLLSCNLCHQDLHLSERSWVRFPLGTNLENLER